MCVILPMRSNPYGESYSPVAIYTYSREEIELNMETEPAGDMSCHVQWLYVGQITEGPRTHALYF